MTDLDLDLSKMALRALLLWVVATTMVILPQSVSAHDIAISGIKIIYRPDDVLVCVSTHLSQLSKAEKLDLNRATPADIDFALRKRVHLRFNGVDFVPGKAFVMKDLVNDQLSWQASVEKSSTGYEVLSRLYPEDSNSSTIVSCVRDGQSVQEDLLSGEHPSLLKNSSSHLIMWRYLQEGFKHILSGADHILFLLGLLLLGGSILSLLRTITAFTLAHSLTLTAAVTGIIVPSTRIIEPLIALSIVAIGLDNLRVLRTWAKSSGDSSDYVKRDWRPLTAFIFGLAHGFGFAGGLIEIGLPKEALWIALISFNLGVEFGQAFIVACLAPLIAFAKNKMLRFYLPFAQAVSILIAATGAIWFATRLVG